ncbi:cupin domain-containing protein [Pollutibacter soli]|uniref:cupin domain-containing protein n=1 Tax=Pollutibacter soli TaxID=3034157 RepID=UPI00301356E4
MIDIKDVPVKHLMSGIDGRYVHGESVTFGEVIISDGTVMPVHQHPHEQVTFILEGTLEMEIGNEIFLLRPGMVHVIPSNTPHGAFAHGNCRVIDVFVPVREEYKTQ